jgi:hypothetical protein
MIELSSVQKGGHVYSCKCGWIDTAHADGDRRDVNVWKQFPGSGGTPKRSPGRRGWLIEYIPAKGIISQTRLPLNFSQWWFVRDLAGGKDAFLRVALRLYQLGNEKMEELQGGSLDNIKHSSFSFEDLPSNTIAWYRGVLGISWEDVVKECQVLGKDDSVKLAKAINVENDLRKNHDWTKALFFNDKCDKCNDNASGFQPLPGKFQTVTPGNVSLTPPAPKPPSRLSCAPPSADAWPYISPPRPVSVVTIPIPIPIPGPLPVPFNFIPVPVPVPIPNPMPPIVIPTNDLYPWWDDPKGAPPEWCRATVPTRYDGLHGSGREPGPLE